MKAIDLFCGCGGMSTGLALSGVEILAGVDINKEYISTFRENFGKEKTFCEDLSRIDPREFREHLRLKQGELDFLVGGPPCQGFSKNVPRAEREMFSQNNMLITTYVNFCREFMPRFIVMENVAEMSKGYDGFFTDLIIKTLSECGYYVSHFVLNAAEYGVPQKRKRSFFVAAKDYPIMGVPISTHRTDKKGSGQQLTLPVEQKAITVWEAIGDLPPIEIGEECDPEVGYAKKPQNGFQEIMRRDSSYIWNHTPKKLAKKQLERISTLKPGQGLKDLPVHLQVKGGYSGAYGILTEDMVCPTITRWVFHPGSGRWGHPRSNRILTLREAARIQSFPDTYKFTGTYTQIAGQIGNAVPPLLMKSIVDFVLHMTGHKEIGNRAPVKEMPTDRVLSDQVA